MAQRDGLGHGLLEERDGLPGPPHRRVRRGERPRELEEHGGEIGGAPHRMRVLQDRERVPGLAAPEIDPAGADRGEDDAVRMVEGRGDGQGLGGEAPPLGEVAQIGQGPGGDRATVHPRGYHDAEGRRIRRVPERMVLARLGGAPELPAP